MNQFLKKASAWLAAIASACLVFLMLITFIDVLGRYLFNAPVTYSVELTELAMGLVIILGLCLTTYNKTHISVDLLTTMLPKGVLAVLTRLSAITGVIFIGMMAWNFWGKVATTKSDGLATQVLFWPVYPFAAIMAVAATFAALISLYFVFAPPAEHEKESDLS